LKPAGALTAPPIGNFKSDTHFGTKPEIAQRGRFLLPVTGLLSRQLLTPLSGGSNI
jgi:hypothetical protein